MRTVLSAEVTTTLYHVLIQFAILHILNIPISSTFDPVQLNPIFLAIPFLSDETADTASKSGTTFNGRTTGYHNGSHSESILLRVNAKGRRVTAIDRY